MPIIPRRAEQVIFVLHGGVVLAAAVVLVVFPAAIPGAVGIAMEPGQYLLSYFLAAAELAIGVLSIAAAWPNDPRMIRLLGMAFATFHLSTAALEIVYLVREGISGVLIANIGIRLIVGAVFLLVGRSERR